jgi:hypothetical protein
MKTGLEEIGLEDVDWFDVTQDMNRGRDLNAEMKLRVT